MNIPSSPKLSPELRGSSPCSSSVASSPAYPSFQMKFGLINLKTRYCDPSQNANTCHAEHSYVLPNKAPVPYTENSSQKFCISTRRPTLPSCRARTRFRAIEVALASLRRPTVLRAVGNVTSLSLPALGTLTLQGHGAAVEPALPLARAVIGTHIETGDRAQSSSSGRKQIPLNY